MSARALFDRIRSHPLASHPLVKQVLMYAAVGAWSTLVHFAVMIALVEFVHAPPLVGVATGYLCGALMGYTLNRRFTFEHRPAFGRGLAKYVALVALGLGLNTLIVGTLTHAGVHYVFAQIVATGIVFFYNFIAARFGVFRPPAKAAAEAGQGAVSD